MNEQDVPGQAAVEEPGTALIQGAAVGTVSVSHDLISDDEMRRMYRLAEALHLSGAFKDVGRAETAFAKMVVGRDLGLTPMQSMQGLHLVEGGVSVHYATLGHFIRSRPGYDFRAAWLKQEPELTLEPNPPGTDPVMRVVTVWMDEEEPDDLREIIGAVVEYKVEGKRRGVSRFTVDDARKAQLIRDNPKAAWNAARRNMLLARAMSNGVKWYVPEVLGGLPVYTDGELEQSRQSITEPVADGGDEGTGVDLGPKVDAVIERAGKLGHAGLSNRGAIELALGNRAPAVVDKWVRDANAELAKMEQEAKDAEEEAAPDGVQDAEVVEDVAPVSHEGDTPATTEVPNASPPEEDEPAVPAEDLEPEPGEPEPKA